MRERRRLALIGLDGMVPTLIERGVAEGWLPTIGDLLASGRGYRLTNPEPMFHDVNWVMAYTGTGAAEHRTILTRQLVPGSYRIEVTPPDRMHRPPFWQYVSDASLSSLIVNAYHSPIVRSLRGLQVMGWVMPRRVGRLRSEPPEIARLLPHRRWREKRMEIPTTNKEILRYRGDLISRVARKSRGMAGLLERNDWDLFFGNFIEPHDAGHAMWHLIDPEHPRYESDPTLTDALPGIYRAIDTAIASILKTVPSGTTTALLWAQSIRRNTRHGEPMTEVLPRGGWLTRQPTPAAGRLRGIRTAMDLSHKLLPQRVRRVLGALVPRDRWVTELSLADVDWPATRAFVLPVFSGASWIRFNVAGREPQGVVRRGEEYDRLCDELTQAIHELVDEDTGVPAAAEVVRTDQALGVPVEDVLPDLCVFWTPDIPKQRLRSPRLGMIDVPITDPRTGDHDPGGWLIVGGPGIRPSDSTRLEGPEFSLLDVAPTVLDLLGIDPPPSLRGEPIPVLDG